MVYVEKKKNPICIIKIIIIIRFFFIFLFTIIAEISFRGVAYDYQCHLPNTAVLRVPEGQYIYADLIKIIILLYMAYAKIK